ncbi:MAG: serine/threonine-protein kinase [Balneolaceae bacterium]|nr:serine/threonine-protein kinase [Balneolaceae bacterium]
MPSPLLHYKIHEKLGEGGMGIIYLADDTKLKRKVALKFLPTHVSVDPEERLRFKQEAQAAAALNHPNIAQVYAIEEIEQELFIVMEYVDGRELRKILDESELTLEDKERIALEIARGIQVAHDQGIIHRDIKSSNIMMDSAGRVKIMDFGLARIQGSEHITKPGTTVGTTSYMAPEQLAGMEADRQSDIWSFGVVLYELFAGKLPFEGLYEPAIMYAITEEEPVPVSALNGEIPSPIEEVIEKCLRKKREQRFNSFDEIINSLKVVSDNETSPISGYYPPGQAAPRNRNAYLAGAAVLLLIVTAVFF